LWLSNAHASAEEVSRSLNSAELSINRIVIPHAFQENRMLKFLQDYFTGSTAPAWLGPIIEISGIVVAAVLFRLVVLRVCRHWAARTATTLDDAIVVLVDRAINPLLALGIIAIALNLVSLPVRLQSVTNRLLTLITIGVALYYTSQLLQLLLDAWLSHKRERVALRDPIQFATKVLFAGLALMIILDNLGISLTAVWTTLGVGSVAIALALQDTLSNFFAGVYLRLDNPVRIGDYIQLSSGEEGYVDHMGWRSTRVRQLANNIVVIPNAKLATTILTNFSMPDPGMSLLISIHVSYDEDVDDVERILIEETTAAAQTVPGLLAEPEPFVRFIPGFGDSSLSFTLICRVTSYVDQYLAQHEIRKRILRRFRQEGITIPFPQRDLHIYSEAVGLRARNADSTKTDEEAITDRRAG
jgi:small-conductance mechanosensitive channel